MNAIPHLDKIGHLGSFFALSFLTYFAFKPKWYVLTILWSCYAILIEMVQSQLAYRHASLADFVADMLGVGLFYLVLWLYSKLFKSNKNLDTPST